MLIKNTCTKLKKNNIFTLLGWLVGAVLRGNVNSLLGLSDDLLSSSSFSVYIFSSALEKDKLRLNTNGVFFELELSEFGFKIWNKSLNFSLAVCLLCLGGFGDFSSMVDVFRSVSKDSLRLYFWKSNLARIFFTFSSSSDGLLSRLVPLGPFLSGLLPVGKAKISGKSGLKATLDFFTFCSLLDSPLFRGEVGVLQKFGGSSAETLDSGEDTSGSWVETFDSPEDTSYLSYPLRGVNWYVER